MSTERHSGHGRVLKKDRVRLDAERIKVSPGPDARATERPTRRDPEVKLRRADDGRVKEITVTCSCGHDIHLTCEYGEETDDGSENE